MIVGDCVQSKGDVEMILEWVDGKTLTLEYNNTVLLVGRRALAKCLANRIEGSFNFYISRMIFGDGGTHNGVKKFVNAGREGLFGITRVSKPVLANINNSIPSQAIFTSVMKYEEGVGVAFNEMALQMANGDLYSMLTFPDLNKTADMQITFNWKINFI